MTKTITQQVLPRRPLVSKLAVLSVVALAGAVAFPGMSGAATAVELGVAEDFVVISGQTVTNTGPSILDGNLGVHPGTAYTGFETSTDPGPGIVNGEVHAGDAVALQAQTDARAAYNALSAEGCTENLTGEDLTGMTLVPGVYCFDSTAALTGDLILDTEGETDPTFIFRAATSITTGSESSVTFLDGASSCNVFWQAGSFVTLGTYTDFIGTVIADTETITATTGTTVDGRLIALTAAVTLDTNTITTTSCAEETVVVPPVDEEPVDETPVDETPVDETPVTVPETPVDETPVVPPVPETPVDEPETPVTAPPVTTPPVTAPPVETPPVPEVPVTPTPPPTAPPAAVPPIVPPVAVPPVAPPVATPPVTQPPVMRPPLAETGSDLTLGGFGAIAVAVGFGLVTLGTKRADSHR